MEIKRQRISKEENCMLPDIKTYYKAVLTKTVGIRTRTKKPMDSVVWYMTKLTLHCSRKKKMVFSINHAGSIGYPYKKKNHWDSHLTIIKIRWTADIWCKNKTKFLKGSFKVLKENKIASWLGDISWFLKHAIKVVAIMENLVY